MTSDGACAQARAYYHANREERLAYQRKYRCGLSPSKFEQMLVDQNNRCKICKREFTDKISPHIDHDHETQEVRGLLCKWCNLRISVLEDSDFVEEARKYLFP